MIENSHNANIVDDDSIIKLDYFVKLYIKYLSIFNCVEIDVNDKKLNVIIEYLDEYIRELIGGQNE